MSPAEPLHVVAGVLRDAPGRVLLAKRPEGKADAGLWEFPGGKVEAGESPVEALRRELREELGIEIDPARAAPLIRVPVAAGSGSTSTEADGPAVRPIRLHLDTWSVDAFNGSPAPHEHAELAWVATDDLERYPMPGPDLPVVAALRGPERLLVTPEPEGEGADADAAFVATVAAALKAGLRRIHLRVSDAQAARRARVAAALVGPCRAAGAALVVHGDADLAEKLGLGLHWRAGQLRDPDARRRTEAHRAAGLHVSAACHDARDLALAEAIGVDDVLVGPVKATATHPGAAGLGWDGFEALRARTSMPVWALGGLGPGDIAAARDHGAQGVAGIRAFWPKP